MKSKGNYFVKSVNDTTIVNGEEKGKKLNNVAARIIKRFENDNFNWISLVDIPFKISNFKRFSESHVEFELNEIIAPAK